MDAESFAIYKALENIYSRDPILTNIYLFVDSQAALKRLQTINLKGGQEICFKIQTLCKKLALKGNKIVLEWIPGHYNIQGNEHADKLAKAGLKQKQIEVPTSISYLKRKLKEQSLDCWKYNWLNSKEKEKGQTYNLITRGEPIISLKVNIPAFSKDTQAAYYQLKLGKGFFKSFSRAIGKDPIGRCFGNCSALQTPKHLILYCKHYSKERKIMQKKIAKLTLNNLFNTRNGQVALLVFLQTTQIATARWLLAAGAL